jgi:hypothetical protein
MDVLLRAFWGMIPVSFIALPYALIAWPLVAARRRRRLPARYATATAGVDSAAFLVAFLVLRLVAMPVGTSGESTLDLVPGADITAAFGDGSLWQVIGNLLLLCPLGGHPGATPGDLPRSGCGFRVRSGTRGTRRSRTRPSVMRLPAVPRWPGRVPSSQGMTAYAWRRSRRRPPLGPTPGVPPACPSGAAVP